MSKILWIMALALVSFQAAGLAETGAKIVSTETAVPAVIEETLPASVDAVSDEESEKLKEAAETGETAVEETVSEAAM
jgi:hypothetical protein